MSFFASCYAYAQEVVESAVTIAAPQEIGQALELLPVIMSTMKNGQWLAFGALISLVVTFIVRKWVLPKLKLGSGVLPLVSALIGMFAGVSLAIANGAEPSAAGLAVLSGPLASTLWDSSIKYFFKK
jgi:hypothetical protein